jgi:prophage regulatory protein
MYSKTTPQYLRVSDIVRNRKTKDPGILPISPSTWWSWVKAGKAPKPVKLSPGVTVWNKEMVLAFAATLTDEGAPQ